MAGNAREIVEGSVPRIPLSNPAGARLRRERSRFVLLPGGDQRDPKLAAHSSVNRVRRADCDEGRYPLNGMFCLWLLTRNTSDRTGAAGVTGSTTVAKGKPDGYTLLLARVGSQAAVSAINRKTPYKWDEFTLREAESCRRSRKDWRSPSGRVLGSYGIRRRRIDAVC